MSEQTARERLLETVLHEYMEAVPNPNYSALVEWIRRYPDFEQELTEFTVTRSLLQTQPAPPAEETTDKRELVQRGMSVVQGILAKQSASAGAPPQFSSFLEAGKIRGLSIHDIAVRSRLSVALIRKLDRRLLRYASIPQEAIDLLAQTLRQQISVITQYLQGGPTLAQGASYRSEKAPALVEQEDFFEAVRNDRTLSDEQRHFWLSLSDSHE